MTKPPLMQSLPVNLTRAWDTNNTGGIAIATAILAVRDGGTERSYSQTLDLIHEADTAAIRLREQLAVLKEEVGSQLRTGR